MSGAWSFYRDKRRGLAGQAYVLQNQVTHVRFLPALSKHSFVYPTVSLLVSLNALESKKLDLLGGWLFGYGGIWGRLTGLRASGYLYDGPGDNRSIKSKLIDILDQYGHAGCELQDAWLMTMPSFLGIQGINPLSVYFCYKQGGSLWLVVLEVHNTFGERHVYVLDTHKSDQIPSKCFRHQWTFPRQFHVSPFNDRSGHYMCQLIAPPRPPRPLEDPSLPLPRPIIKVTLLTAPPNAERKLVAVLRATHSAQLSSISLLWALAQAPLGLLLAFPRIVYQAYILHYRKRLDVYQRPEPCAPKLTVELRLPAVPNSVQIDTNQVGRGVGWQKKGSLERWCELRVYAFLRRQCAKGGASVTFISANPAEDRTTISPPNIHASKGGHTLTIYYRSPRIFAILFMMPSPKHALLFGVHAEKVFSVSSEALFNEVFAAPSPVVPQQPWRTRLARHIRGTLVPNSLGVPFPSSHALDDPMTVSTVFVLFLFMILTRFEEKLFKTLGARFVRGDEPWAGWTRLHSSSLSRSWGRLGSVRRQENM